MPDHTDHTRPRVSFLTTVACILRIIEKPVFSFFALVKLHCLSVRLACMAVLSLDLLLSRLYERIQPPITLQDLKENV